MMLRLAAILLFSTFTLNAHAASVTVMPLGKGIYTLQCNNMDGVAGIEMKIDYPATLSSPTVTQENLVAGAMMATDTSTRGSIKIVIINTRTFSGSGQIATISFKSHTATVEAISVLTTMIDSKGAPVSADNSLFGNGLLNAGIPISATPPPVSTVPPAPNSALTAAAKSTSTERASTSTGIVRMPIAAPAEAQKASNDSPATPEPAQLPKPSTQPQPQPEPEKPSPPSSITHKGVFEHFRDLKEERIPAACKALFTQQLSTIRQEPPIAISDGATPVIIVVKLEGSKPTSPNFALSNARLVSITKENSTWIIKTIPQAQTLQAGLTILSGETIIEFPLTLVPPVEGISPAEGDFAAFLKDSGVTPPKRDLNGDGIHDYQDDYIYTAHYLMNQKRK